MGITVGVQCGRPHDDCHFSRHQAENTTTGAALCRNTDTKRKAANVVIQSRGGHQRGDTAVFTLSRDALVRAHINTSVGQEQARPRQVPVRHGEAALTEISLQTLSTRDPRLPLASRQFAIAAFQRP